jgi:hypothetical protein
MGRQQGVASTVGRMFDPGKFSRNLTTSSLSLRFRRTRDAFPVWRPQLFSETIPSALAFGKKICLTTYMDTYTYSYISTYPATWLLPTTCSGYTSRPSRLRWDYT